MSTVDPHSGHVHSDAEMPKVHEVPAAEPTAIDPVCGMTVSLKPDKDAAIVDVGAGSSRLVDCLLEQGFRRITVLDLSETALAKARSRQSQDASVEWVVANVLRWQPSGRFDVWHDRAAFHFLTEASDQDAYLRVMDGTGLRPPDRGTPDTYRRAQRLYDARHTRHGTRGIIPSGERETSAITRFVHVWMPPFVQAVFERFERVIGCGHVSGLSLRR